MTEYTGPKSIADLLFPEKFEKKKASKDTERGDLLKEFSGKIGMPIGFVAHRLTGVSTPDLYALQKTCQGARNYSSMWWWQTDPKNAKK